MSKEQTELEADVAYIEEEAPVTQGISAARCLVNAFKVKDDTFPVELYTQDETGEPVTHIIRFKSIKSTAQLNALKVKGNKFFRMCMNQPPKDYRPYLEKFDQETAHMVMELVELSVSPKFTDIDALEMARDAAPTLVYLHSEILEHLGKNSGALKGEELEELKK